MDIHSIDILSLSGSGMRHDCEGQKHIKSLPFLSVVQAIEGSYDIALNDGRTFSTGEGGIFIAPAEVKQTIIHHNGKSGKMCAQWAFMEISINNNFFLDDLFDLPILMPESKLAAAGEHIQTICSDAPLWEKYAAGYRLAGILIESGKPKSVPDETHMLIRSFVAANFGADIGSDDIAAHIHCSVSQVFRYTRKYFGMSPANYINSVRLRRAAELLELTQHSIGDIAVMIGFSDTSYFSRLFRQAFGMPPGNYRQTTARKHH